MFLILTLQLPSLAEHISSLSHLPVMISSTQPNHPTLPEPPDPPDPPDPSLTPLQISDSQLTVLSWWLRRSSHLRDVRGVPLPSPSRLRSFSLNRKVSPATADASDSPLPSSLPPCSLIKHIRCLLSQFHLPIHRDGLMKLGYRGFLVGLPLPIPLRPMIYVQTFSISGMEIFLTPSFFSGKRSFTFSSLYP